MEELSNAIAQASFDRDSKHREYVIACCSDGKIAMSQTEFKDLLDAGNVLNKLVYGDPDMRSEVQFDVFSHYHDSCHN